MIGRWIDGLAEEQRDRIVSAQGWQPGEYIRPNGHACLIGHASGLTLADVTGWDGETARIPTVDLVDARSPAPAKPWRNVWEQFDALCKRFGTDRVVRAIKLRAGAPLPPIASPAEPHALTDGRTHG